MMTDQQHLRKVDASIYEGICYTLRDVLFLFLDHFDVLDGYYEYKYGNCHNNGQMALAILLTMIFTAIFTLLIKWCFNRRRHRYHKAESDIRPLAMDDQ